MAWSYRLSPCVLILVCHLFRATAIKVCPLDGNRKIVRINLNVPLDKHSLYFWTAREEFEYTVQSPAFPTILTKVMHIQEANVVQDDLGGWWYVVPRSNLLWDYCRLILSGDEHAKTLWLCTGLDELYVTFPAEVSLGTDCKASGKTSAKILDFRLPMLCAALVLVALFGACRLLLACREKCKDRGAAEGREGGGGGGGGAGERGVEGRPEENERKPASEILAEDLPPSYDDVMRDVVAPPPPYTSLKIENLPQTA